MRGKVINFKILEIEAATLAEAVIQAKEECQGLGETEKEWDDFDYDEIYESFPSEDDIRIRDEAGILLDTMKDEEEEEEELSDD